MIGTKGFAILILTLMAALILQHHIYRGYLSWEGNRTKAERLFDDENHYTHLSTFQKMERLAEIDPESNDGLRIQISQFSGWHYDVTLQTGEDNEVRGMIAATKWIKDGEYEDFSSLLKINSEDGRQLTEYLSTPINNVGLAWRMSCLDGVTVAYEQWDSRQVKSGNSNGACVPEYAKIVRIVDNVLTRNLRNLPADLPLSKKTGVLAKGD